MEDFIYKEDTKNCWYAKTCPHYNEDGCKLSFCQRHYKLELLTYKGLLFGKDRYLTKLFSDADGVDYEEFTFLTELSKNILTFVSEGRSLVIRSTITGNGKSSWAKRLMISYFDKIWHSCEFDCQALFIDMPKFLNELKGTFNGSANVYVNHIINNITEVPLVVWDEIGAKKISETEREYLLNFLNTRISFNRANIFTTNQSDSTLQEYLGERLFSRTISNSKNIILKGVDKRKFNAKW